MTQSLAWVSCVTVILIRPNVASSFSPVLMSLFCSDFLQVETTSINNIGPLDVHFRLDIVGKWSQIRNGVQITWIRITLSKRYALLQLVYHPNGRQNTYKLSHKFEIRDYWISDSNPHNDHLKVAAPKRRLLVCCCRLIESFRRHPNTLCAQRTSRFSGYRLDVGYCHAAVPCFSWVTQLQFPNSRKDTVFPTSLV